MGWYTAVRNNGIVHLLYEVPRDFTICVQRLCSHPYGKVSQQAAQIRTAVVPNTICVNVLSWEWCTATCIIGIVSLLDEVPRHYLLCVQRQWHSYDDVSHTAVYIRTVDMPKCGLRQSAPLCLVHCHVHCHHRTYTVRGASGSSNLCTKVAWAPVTQLK